MEIQSENNDNDEVIIPIAPLYGQILNLYIEKNAIEDSTFYLEGPLRQRNRPGCLLKACFLSGRQFQLRALMQKARKNAGPSDLYCLL